MSKRIITAMVAAAVFLPVLYFSDYVIFAIAMALCAVVGMWEMLRCIGLHRVWGLSIPYLLCAAAFPMAIYYVNDAQVMSGAIVFALIVLALYSFAVMTFSHSKLDLSGVAAAFMTAFYIVAAFTSLCLLRYTVPAGRYVYLICFIGAWTTDIFAYFCGFLLGKHKLIPDVSPKKTVEGSIGGVLFCVIAMVVYGLIVRWITAGAIDADFLMLCISGILISVVSQIGDLLMSAIKRKYGVKDYGRIFPGHGGVLDRFDSVLAVALVLCLITSMTDLFTVV